MTSLNPSKASKSSKKKESGPNFKQKFDSFEIKYLEIINSIPSYIQSPHPRSRPSTKATSNEKRGQSNEFLSENAKLKRKNEILTKTIEELNNKILTLEANKTDQVVSKEFESKINQKKEILEKQEQDLLKLKKELEKSKLEVNLLKNSYTERDKSSRGQSQPLKKSISPVNQRFYPKQREYSPIERKASVSPISQVISPAARKNHTLKKKLQNIQEKLSKAREERDLYKIWQKYCVENPPLPPAVGIIVAQYEAEINKVCTLNSILKNNMEKLIKPVKDLISETSKSSVLRSNQNLEALKMKITDLLRDINPVKSFESKEFTRKNEIDLALIQKSKQIYERENKDLEDILRREQSRANFYSDELDSKAIEICELKQTLENFSFLDKGISMSAPITTENFYDAKSYLFENPKSLNNMNETIKTQILDLENYFIEKLSKIFQFLCEKNEAFKNIFRVTENFSKAVISQKNLHNGLRIKQEEIINENKKLSQKVKKNEIELIEMNKEKQLLNERIKLLMDEKTYLSKNLIQNEKDKKTAESKLLEFEIKTNKLESKKRKVFEVVFENSFSLNSSMKLSEDTLKLSEFFYESTGDELSVFNLKKVLNKVAESKSLKNKYRDAMKIYIDLKREYDQIEQQLEHVKNSGDRDSESNKIKGLLENALKENENLLKECELLKIEILKLKDEKTTISQILEQSNQLAERYEKASLILEDTLNENRILVNKNEILIGKVKNLEAIIHENQYIFEKNEILTEENKKLERFLEEHNILQSNFQNLSVKYNSAVSEINILEEKLNQVQQQYEKVLQENLRLIERNEVNETSKKNLNSNQAENHEIELLQSYIKNLESLNSSLEKAVSKQKAKISKKASKIRELNDLLSAPKIGPTSNRVFSICGPINFFVYPQNEEKRSISHVWDLKISPNTSKQRSYSLTQENSGHNLIRAESLEEMPEIILNSNSIAEKVISRHEEISGRNSSLEISVVLEQLTKYISENSSETVVEWCRNLLVKENYILRYQSSNESIISEDSRSQIDEISIVSDSNSQEINYRSHAKMAQQKKIIDSLVMKLKEKKERLKISKSHIKTLQNEIRNLDSKINQNTSLDLEYLKATMLNFAKKLKKIDKDSLTILQIIFSQLGLSMEELIPKEEKKRWGLFSKN